MTFTKGIHYYFPRINFTFCQHTINVRCGIFFLFSSTGFIKFQSNIVVWRNWRRILKNWTQIPNKFSEMLKTVRLTCEKPCFLGNIRIWHLSSGVLCIHQKKRKIQGMMLDFLGHFLLNSFHVVDMYYQSGKNLFKKTILCILNFKFVFS